MRSLPFLLLLPLLLLLGCGTEYPNCKNNDDCPGENQFCRDGLCRGCLEDSDCEGLCGGCKEGRCIRKAGCCESDGECPAEYSKCGEDNLCMECRIDSHCSNQADVCTKGVCQLAQCAHSSDCPTAKECVERRCRYKELCEFQVIYFETGRARLTDHQKSRLRENATCFQQYRDETGNIAQLKITGYADERNTEPPNMQLSKRRARSVLKELKAIGVNLDLVHATAKGEQQPVISGAQSEFDHAHNRRVEFYIY